MITRVIIKAGTLKFCKCFVDEEELTKEVDNWLSEHNLNDGHTGFTIDDAPALNAMLAEKYGDDMNLENYCQCDEDFEERINDAIDEKMNSFGYDYDGLIKLAEFFCIKIEEL